MSDIGTFARCPTCREYGWLNSHRCAPIWQAREVAARYQNDWVEVRGRDAEEAATKYCEETDQYGDYSIVRAGEATVEVRKAPDFEMEDDEIAAIPIQTFDVTAESVPQYSAYEKSAPAEAAKTSGVATAQKPSEGKI
jgi:hypothetical protein